MCHHCDPELNVERICREMGMSRANLNRRIKALTGEAVMEHLRRMRMETAAIRIFADQDSISAIAYDCGFTDPNYFCRAFAKAYHCSPTEYRSQQISLSEKSRNLSED